MERAARLGIYAATGAAIAYMLARSSSTTAPSSGAAGGVIEEIAVTTRRMAQGFLPRGIRLNNPGNIRKSLTKWQGLAPVQNDVAYCTFIDASWGLRAMARILNTYRANGFDTVRKIVNRYAPPVENQTTAYVTHVSQKMGLGPDQRLSWPADLPRLMAAMITHENGFNPYTSAEIAEGIRKAA